MNSVESKTISKEELQEAIESIILETGNAMVTKEFTLDSLSLFLRTQKYKVALLSKKTVLDENTFVVQCVSKPCFDAIMANTEIFRKQCMKGDNIYVLTPKMLTLFPYEKLNTKTFVGMEKHHVVELRTLMNK